LSRGLAWSACSRRTRLTGYVRVEELIVANMCVNCRGAMWIVVTGRGEIGVPISNMVEEKPKV
jgi:hypothetical protein